VSNTLERHSFSELLALAGELLHTPMRVSTFMTTDPLSSASSILKRGSLSEHLDIPGTFSEHPASPVLLTSKGPQKTQATLRFGRIFSPRTRKLAVQARRSARRSGTPLAACNPGVRFLHSLEEGHREGRALVGPARLSSLVGSLKIG